MLFPSLNPIVVTVHETYFECSAQQAYALTSEFSICNFQCVG